MGYRHIKSLHGWLGLFAWPWVLMIALTGLYQNHAPLIDPWLPGAPLTEARLAALPDAPVTEAEAAALLGPADPVTVFGQPGWQAKDGTGGVEARTGTRWQVGTFATVWTSAGGERLGWRVDWQRLAIRLHRAGWADERLGTWPADLVALGLCTFALSGLWLFLSPRVRRWRRG